MGNARLRGVPPALVVLGGVVTYHTEPDGTRVYAHGHRYKPLELSERKYRKLKPADAQARGAVPFHGIWYYPLEVLPEEARTFPWTRPDEEAIAHKLGCLCYMCRNVPRITRKKRARFRRELLAHPDRRR